MALATQTAPQARVGAPIYVTHHKPLMAFGIRAADSLAVGVGETIDMCKVPKGARVLDAGIICSASGTCEDADLGLYDTVDQATIYDADGLIDDADLTTSVLNRAGGATTNIQLGVLLTLDCYVRLTCNSIALTDDVDVWVWVSYIMP